MTSPEERVRETIDIEFTWSRWIQFKSNSIPYSVSRRSQAVREIKVCVHLIPLTHDSLLITGAPSGCRVIALAL